MSREELWNKTITALAGVEDETERAQIAQELFGKGAMEMGALLNMSAEEIEAMKQQAHDLGIVMDEEDVKAAAAFKDSLQNMTQSFNGLKNKMMAEFLPGITTVMDGLTSIFSGDTEGGVGKIKEGIGQISEKLKEVLPTIVETGSQIVSSILGAITESLPLLLPAAASIITELAANIVKVLPSLLETGVDILTELIKGIVDNGPEMMKNATSVLTNFMTAMSESSRNSWYPRRSLSECLSPGSLRTRRSSSPARRRQLQTLYRESQRNCRTCWAKAARLYRTSSAE
jgi:hypothetical protein